MNIDKIQNKKSSKIIFFISIFFVVLSCSYVLSFQTTFAQTDNSGVLFEGLSNDTEVIDNKTVDHGICTNTGNCGVSDIVTVAINITKFLTLLIGSIALLFFIIAGIKMLLSHGNPQAVSSAKQMMLQTVIGILVFFSAYLIVSFTRQVLLNDSIYNKTQLNQNYTNDGFGGFGGFGGGGESNINAGAGGSF